MPLLNEDNYATLRNITFGRSEHRKLTARAEATIRLGPKGARLEAETILTIESCFQVKINSLIPKLHEKQAYCVIYWNRIEVGRTKGLKIVDKPIISNSEDRLINLVWGAGALEATVYIIRTAITDPKEMKQVRVCDNIYISILCVY